MTTGCGSKELGLLSPSRRLSALAQRCTRSRLNAADALSAPTFFVRGALSLLPQAAKAIFDGHVNRSVGYGVAGHSMGGQATVFSSSYGNATGHRIRAAVMHHAFTHDYPAPTVPFLAFTGVRAGSGFGSLCASLEAQSAALSAQQVMGGSALLWTRMLCCD